MKLHEYVGNVQQFKKTELLQLVTVIEVNSTDLVNNIERMLVNKIDLSAQINQWAVTKSIVRDMDNNGFRGIGFNKGVEAALRAVQLVAAELEKQIKGSKDNVWDGRLINLRQANILITIEQLDHWLRYTTLMYDVLMSLNNQANNNPDSLVSKVDLRFLTQTAEYYKGTLIWLLRGAKAIITDLNNIPEVEVTEQSISVMESNDMRTTLAGQDLGIHHFNPKYWWKLNRMKSHIEEIEQIRHDNEHFAMKITQAVNLKNGTNDADLDSRIEDYQDRILKGKARIADIDAMYRSPNA